MLFDGRLGSTPGTPTKPCRDSSAPGANAMPSASSAAVESPSPVTVNPAPVAANVDAFDAAAGCL